MKTLILLPNSKRLKQVVQEFGDVFYIVDGPKPIPCFDNKEGFFIISLCGAHARNVRIEDTNQFTKST